MFEAERDAARGTVSVRAFFFFFFFFFPSLLATRGLSMASLCAVSGTRQVSSPLLESPRPCLGCEIEETLNPFFVVASLFLFPSKEKKRDFTHLDAHATKRRRKKTCPRPSPRLLRSSFPADRVPVRSTLPLPLLFFVRARRRVPKRPTRERHLLKRVFLVFFSQKCVEEERGF